MNILCFGDIFGESGITVFDRNIGLFKDKYKPDLIVVNAENSGPYGKGPVPHSFDRIFASGAHVLTGGNHSFDRRESYSSYNENKNILRPCNFPAGCPGVGYTIYNNAGNIFAVINVQLRVFMREQLSCPFRAVDSLLPMIQTKTNQIIIDVHGEATAEKLSFAAYFDGKISVIFGTHTHVQTSDERIMPKGTAYITDIGTTGAFHSSLGVKFESTITNFVTQLPGKFEVEIEPPFIIGGLFVKTDDQTGKALVVERITHTDKNPV